MKQYKWLIVIVLAATLLLAACGGDEAAVDETQTDVEVTRVAEQPEASPSEEATLPPPVVDAAPTPTLAPGANAPEGNEPQVNEPATEPETVAEPAQPAPIYPWPADRFGYGVQIHGNATVGDPVQTMDAAANQLGMDWVKIQLLWPVIHPDPEADQWFFYDGVIDEANKAGLNVMLSIVGAPEWTRAAGGENGPPDDYSLYADFLQEVLTRHEGQIHAIEVWNEMNLDREWATANGISPEDYVRFLETAYNAIKAQDPDVIVISGALAPTGDGDWVRWADDFAWLDRALAAGMLDYADCVGVHHNGYNIAPDVPFDQAGNTAEASTASFRGPFDNPHHSWSFKTTLDTYAAKVQAVDPNMKLCVTEFGWASAEGMEQVREGFGFAYDNTLEEQAQYIVDAYQQMHDSGNVWLTFLHNFDFGNKAEPGHETALYSIIDANGIPRPAYGAVSEMEKTP